eukprot:CAMPEP_0183344554 /NCGR_PEP_ID=MMETSP0164_2-20130417/10203_1 /TAXON_ID=221442 /ORGANISM="Coccolithus pelagicus ssp braarudi, Strain PLY182g" /LENGTH=135 /DNA_ID=CAMNT_0025515565 /DNA_START=12 /DNA_END=416 /DNA_ORIENTATION=+
MLNARARVLHTRAETKQQVIIRSNGNELAVKADDATQLAEWAQAIERRVRVLRQDGNTPVHCTLEVNAQRRMDCTGQPSTSPAHPRARAEMESHDWQSSALSGDQDASLEAKVKRYDTDSEPDDVIQDVPEGEVG